ncbi:hypothetical protein EVAR_48631_1 [Eumeta japonica]|uniref:Uncharacterized protein n=1 Tax=Eumeta variegata TaxID=151549 RepID=A0A4C1XRG6_EUMVA|nr:hypothetical protein EVAR_48631_1 [Eumeta japonica]
MTYDVVTDRQTRKWSYKAFPLYVLYPQTDKTIDTITPLHHYGLSDTSRRSITPRALTDDAGAGGRSRPRRWNLWRRMLAAQACLIGRAPPPRRPGGGRVSRSEGLGGKQKKRKKKAQKDLFSPSLWGLIAAMRAEITR